jgi:hypothetical protein
MSNGDVISQVMMNSVVHVRQEHFGVKPSFILSSNGDLHDLGLEWLEDTSAEH